MSTNSFIARYRNFILRATAFCALALCACGFAAPVAAQPPAEIRAFWVDAFHAGIRTPQEADQLVADAKRAGVNTLFVQVRRRGDALYRKSVEPPLEDPAYDSNFDALANIIEVAHRAGIEVHAWINAMPVWRDETPPRDPRHVFNQHGLAAQGPERWLTESPAGETKFLVGYFLDPGHPAAAEYLNEIYLNIVRNYAVDGIHFDYIRYPETAERLPRGAPVGYNARNLERFRAATGKPADYRPDPSDQAWIEWRRKQVTNLVRRIYVEAKMIRPNIKVSAALIPWGKPPTNEKDFADVAPMQRIFQDWHGWLKEGILDLAVPMNYAREHDPVVRGWFDGWIRWEKKHKHGRQLAVGVGAYVNTQPNTLAQIERVRRKEGRHSADGVSFFSYASMFPAAQPAANAGGSAPASAADAAVRAGAAFPTAAASTPTGTGLPQSASRVAFLADGAAQAKGAFAQPASVPRMDWMENPRTALLAGRVEDSNKRPVDGALIFLKGGFFSRARRLESDGNGWFGSASLKPGKYKMRAEHGGRKSVAQKIEVRPGQPSRLQIQLP